MPARIRKSVGTVSCWAAAVVLANSLAEAQVEPLNEGPPIAVPTLAFSNLNASRVQRHPRDRTVLRLTQPLLATQITTCHWPLSEAVPAGTISLQRMDGSVLGEWPAEELRLDSEGKEGKGRLWVVRPNVTLPPGEYRVLDSREETWAWNGQSGGAGLVQVWGLPQDDEASGSGTAPPAKGTRRHVLGGLILDAPEIWQARPDPQGRTVGLHLGAAASPEATVEVIRRSQFDEFFTWLIEDRKAELSGRETLTIAGRAATAYSYTVSDPARE